MNLGEKLREPYLKTRRIFFVSIAWKITGLFKSNWLTLLAKDDMNSYIKKN